MVKKNIKKLSNNYSNNEDDIKNYNNVEITLLLLLSVAFLLFPGLYAGQDSPSTGAQDKVPLNTLCSNLITFTPGVSPFLQCPP